MSQNEKGGSMLSTFEKYLRFEKRYSDHTIIAYLNDIRQFVKYYELQYGLLAWKEVKHFHIRGWMVQLVGQEIVNRSIHRKLSSLQTFFKFLMRQQKLDKNPLKKIIAPKVGKRLPDVIGTERIDFLFTSDAFSNDVYGLRDRLVLEILYQTGMRRSELKALTWRDFNPQKQWLKVFGKGGKERIIPIGPGLSNLLKSFQRQSQEKWGQLPSNLLVTNKGKAVYDKWIYNTVKKYLSLITTSSKRSPHVLRHSFATGLVNQGAELNAVKELLGHANLSATQVYTHNSIEQLKQVYAAAHPKAGKQ